MVGVNRNVLLSENFVVDGLVKKTVRSSLTSQRKIEERGKYILAPGTYRIFSYDSQGDYFIFVRIKRGRLFSRGRAIIRGRQ